MSAHNYILYIRQVYTHRTKAYISYLWADKVFSKLFLTRVIYALPDDFGA